MSDLTITLTSEQLVHLYWADLYYWSLVERTALSGDKGLPRICWEEMNKHGLESPLKRLLSEHGSALRCIRRDCLFAATTYKDLAFSMINGLQAEEHASPRTALGNCLNAFVQHGLGEFFILEGSLYFLVAAAFLSQED